MKITGIILLIFAALNFLVAIIAAGSGAGEAAGQKFSATILLGVIGGVLYYFGNKKTKEKETQNTTQQSNMVNRPVQPMTSEQPKPQPQQVEKVVETKPTEQPQKPEISQDVDSNEDDDYPKPLGQLTPSDMNRLMTEFQDEMLSIMADGGTKEQSQVKMELLLGKRSKTEGMLAIEKEIRSFFREIYESVGEETVNNNASGNPLLRKMAVTTALLNAHQRINDGEESAERKQMREIANAYGVSINLLDDEEYKRALSIYRDGEQP
ncbi:MAG: hypothetical protein J6X70_04075 [Muribaculaceae bacterium]|nr:hypothetical protein [Muribaculaceae bacterium]